MKVLFANNYGYIRGGAERVLFDEMSLLESKGVSASLFSRQHPENFKFPKDFLFPPHLEYVGANPLDKLKTAFELVYSSRVAKSFKEFMQKEQPDVLHGHNTYGRLTTAVFDVAQQESVPAVLTLHDYKLICPSYLLMRNEHICELCVKGRVFHCFTKRCHKGSLAASAVYTAEAYFVKFFKKYRKVKFFISPSRFLVDKHVEGGIPRDKLMYIPNAVNVSGFEPLFAKGGYVLFVGRLSKEKGIATLLESMVGLDIPIKIVGDGPLRQHLEHIAHEKNIKDASFLGYRDGDELKKLYREAAFLVFPSEWYENAPMTILEAYGYGKPVIGAEIGGIPEMIVNGETGVLFPPGDSESLRDRIVELWNKPEAVKEMGKAARRRVELEYNAPLHYERLMEVYKKAQA